MEARKQNLLVTLLSGLLMGTALTSALFVMTIPGRSTSEEATYARDSYGEELLNRVEVLQNTLIMQTQNLSDLLHQVDERQKELLVQQASYTPGLNTEKKNCETDLPGTNEITTPISLEEKHTEHLQFLLLKLNDPEYRAGLTMNSMANELNEMPPEYKQRVTARINELLQSGEINIEDLARVE